MSEFTENSEGRGMAMAGGRAMMGSSVYREDDRAVGIDDMHATMHKAMARNADAQGRLERLIAELEERIGPVLVGTSPTERDGERALEGRQMPPILNAMHDFASQTEEHCNRLERLITRIGL